MKMSIDLYNKLDSAVCELSKKTDLVSLKRKMLQSGNSETRFAMDVFYMIQGHTIFRREIDLENLNDDHLVTAMRKITKHL